MNQLTDRQALVHYHAAYNNDHYATVTDAILDALAAGSDLTDEALRNTPDYIALSNMLTDTALEICGHPAYHGVGWQLATSLNAVLTPRLKAGDLDDETARMLFHRINGYLGRYR